MCILDRVTVHTALEPDSLFFFLFALTESEVLLSCEFSTMEESLTLELVHDTIESRLIHLTCFDEFCLQCPKGSGFRLFEV